MRVLITGNLGYVGTILTQHLRRIFPEAELIGFDIGYFAQNLTGAGRFPEVNLNAQVFGDIRSFPEKLLEGTDAILNLAAISNDPIGNRFAEVTMEVNYRAAERLAGLAKKYGVKHFVFASSCSIYGAASDSPKLESDNLNPLTAYARSKVEAERALETLADESFIVTCLRFATACGFSQRLRLDLVLNDFVAAALMNGEISILSDGTPWRPLINVRDMARAFEWALGRGLREGGAFLAVNTGSNDWNIQVRELAEAVASQFDGVRISVNPKAERDKRSYRVNFDLFHELAPAHIPVHDLVSTIRELRDGLRDMGFADDEFRQSRLIRLNELNRLLAMGALDESLQWDPAFRKQDGTRTLSPVHQ